MFYVLNAGLEKFHGKNFWDAPDFSGAHILPYKKEETTLDLQVFSQIGKTMKKLKWILSTIMNTSVL